MRTLPLLALSACCAAPKDGTLPAGTWGGDPNPQSLTVRADGSGSLDLACFGGAAIPR